MILNKDMLIFLKILTDNTISLEVETRGTISSDKTKIIIKSIRGTRCARAP